MLSLRLLPLLLFPLDQLHPLLMPLLQLLLVDLDVLCFTAGELFLHQLACQGQKTSSLNFAQSLKL